MEMTRKKVRDAPSCHVPGRFCVLYNEAPFSLAEEDQCLAFPVEELIFFYKE